MAGWGIWYTSLVLLATVHSKEMDMAPNAVDDAYSTCRVEMLQKTLEKDGILHKELKAEAVFQSAWNMSNCLEPIPGGQQEHTRALQSLGSSGPLLKEFNEAVYSMGNMYTEFRFKSLHFLLMDAMRLLKKECRTVYHSTFEDIIAVKNNSVRFGKFIPAYREYSFAEEGCADGGTLFAITSCSVIDVEKHACTPENAELLISPAEVFEVVDVKSDSDCKREIVLTSQSFKNDHNCYLFPRVATTITPTVHTPSPKGDSSDKGSSAQWAGSPGVVLLTTVLHMCLIFLAL